MKYVANERIAAGLRVASTILCSLTALSGILIIIGWAFDVPFLKSPFHDQAVPVKFNTAVCFLLAGISSLLLQHGGKDGLPKARRVIGLAMAFATGVIAVMNMAGLTLGMGRGLSPWNTALIFLMISGALLTLDVVTKNGRRPSQYLLIIALTLSFIAMIGYFWEVPLLYGSFLSVTGMAHYTVMLMSLFCIGIFFMRPKNGFVALLSSSSHGGMILRRILPPMIILLYFTYRFEIVGVQEGIFEPKLAAAIGATVRIFFFFVVVWIASRQLDKVDAEKDEVSKELGDLEEELNKVKDDDQVRIENASDELNMIFDAMTDLVFVQDRDFVITRVNSVFAKYLKMDPEEIVGKKCYEILHDKDRPWENCPFERTRVDGKPHTEEVIDPRIGIPLLVTTSPIFDKNREMIGSVHIAKDISAMKRSETQMAAESSRLENLNEKLRKTMNDLQERDQRLFNMNEKLESAMTEIEKQKSRLDAIINDMGEGILVFNKQNDIEMMNGVTGQLLGYKDLASMPAGYKNFLISQLWKDLNESNERTVVKELKIERPNEIILSVVISRLSDREGKNSGFVAVLRDITVEKRLEQMKSDFVANVSHEIRSPMGPMKESLELVLDGTAGPLNDKQKKFLDILQNNIDRLLRLINDLLDISKMEAGKTELARSSVNMDSLLNECVESMRLFAQKRSVGIDYRHAKDIPSILCDKDRIIQVVVNLLNNSIKFTPEGGNVKVRCEAGRFKPMSDDALDERNGIIVSVSDTGPGMSKEETEQLFDRYKQLSSGREAKGTGLGLAISKAIIELHGGNIWVESKLGNGSTFKFALPVA